MLDFLDMCIDSLSDILAFDLVTGLSIQTILFYDLLLVCFFSVFAHRR